MARAVFEDFPDADVSVSIVWVAMLRNDDETTAGVASAVLTDARVHQFYDPMRLVGGAYAEHVFPGWAEQTRSALPPPYRLFDRFRSCSDRTPDTHPLWDMVLFYDRGVEWSDQIPRPTRWIKQLAFYGSRNGETSTSSGLFYRDDFSPRPVGSDWFVELRTVMSQMVPHEPEAQETMRVGVP